MNAMIPRAMKSPLDVIKLKPDIRLGHLGV